MGNVAPTLPKAYLEKQYLCLRLSQTRKLGGDAQPPVCLKLETMEEILQRLDAIERNTLLAAKNVLGVADVALLLGVSKSQIYELVQARQISYYKPRGKQLYFNRSEVEAWMMRNKVETQEEGQRRAAAYIIGKEA